MVNLLNEKEYSLMIMLSGEQTAPNLLTARHFKPEQVYILHTDFWKSELMAKRLRMRLTEMNPRLFCIDAYDPEKITEQITKLITGRANTLVNITGGTKPMSIGALEAARQTNCQPVYVTSQRAKTNLNFYGFSGNKTPFIQESITIERTISLDDYLVSYFGDKYQFTGFCDGPGEAFERVICEVLKPPVVDEIKMGWKHESGAVDVDAVVRCNNQVGIIEVKTGGKARKTDGIKQLAVAGGQRFFGTYTKLFLVIDQEWSEKSNNKALAEALNITLIELPGYAENGELNAAEKDQLIRSIHEVLGKPIQ